MDSCQLCNALQGPLRLDFKLSNHDHSSGLEHNAYHKYVQTEQKHYYGCKPGLEIIRLSNTDAIADISQQIKSGSSRATLLDGSAGPSLRCPSVIQPETLDLVARFLLVARVGRMPTQINPGNWLDWQDESLHETATRQFSNPSTLDCTRSVVTRGLDAWSISVVAGIEIQLTDNLADHLQLVNGDTLLYIFHHASYLEIERHKDIAMTSPTTAILPSGMAEETLKTLALLFPQSDYSSPKRSTRAKRAWLKRLCDTHNEKFDRTIDTRLSRCGNPKIEGRQLSNYHVWRERLYILNEVYDQSTPETYRQWWHDKRNGAQWHNFWVAIVVLAITAFLGLIQCILSAVQVYKAYHSN